MKAILDGKTIPVNDYENVDEVLGQISLESIEKGERLMQELHFSHFVDIVSGNDDATTADVWFQLCVLGDITFG
jgi:hypothetical protein